MVRSSQVSAVAQRDPVGLGDVIGLDGSKSFTQAFAGLPQELEGVGGGALCGSAIRISAVLLDEVRLKCRSHFVCRLQRMVDGPVPCGVVNHAASIPRSLLRNAIRDIHGSELPVCRTSPRLRP